MWSIVGLPAPALTFVRPGLTPSSSSTCIRLHAVHAARSQPSSSCALSTHAPFAPRTVRARAVRSAHRPRTCRSLCAPSAHASFAPRTVRARVVRPAHVAFRSRGAPKFLRTSPAASVQTRVPLARKPWAPLPIRELIRQHGIPHTSINVGWWMQIVLPIPLRSAAPMALKSFTCRIIGSLPRIITDPRTLNQAVMVWEDKVTQFDTQDIGARISADGDKMKEL